MVMDPVGPWSAYAASYNRLAGASGSFQAGSASSGSEFHHLAAGSSNASLGHQPPSTTSQLLLQAAHTTATLAASSAPSPFNPGSFLSPPAVGYDAVFTPLFHHANQKQAHYVNQHRQALAQASKQSVMESELNSLRENYNTHHQNLASGSSFFEHQTSGNSPGSSLPWSHQGNAQLPSPFGILPHETVATSSPGPATTSKAYENSFNAHLAAAQNSLNHLNSQLSAVAASSNYDKKASARAQSPLVTPVKPVVSSAAFFHQAPTTTAFNAVEARDCLTYAPGNKSQQQQQQFTAAGPEFANSASKGFSGNAPPSLHHQQSCIVSTPVAGTKEYRLPHQPSRTSSNSHFLNSSTSSRSQNAEKQSSRTQSFVPKSSPHHSIQTKAQTKIYPELNNSTDHSRRSEETSQSSPISFAMMDAATHRATINYTGNTNPGTNVASKLPQRTTSAGNLQQFQHTLGQQQGTSYHSRQYANDVEYQRKSSSTDSYSVNSTNGSDCGVVVPRRPKSDSQANVPSPVYPTYNSPMTTITSPSPLQQQQQQPPSPLDVTVPRPSPQGAVAYPSVITRAEASSRTFDRQPCWESRKFSPAASSGYGSAGDQASSLGISERQQAYFDPTPTHQDLSSCRGDPMTIVKTLQQQQPIGVDKSAGTKRRKSAEKTGEPAVSEYFTSRVPPPAHHNANQQQQNGGYFDFERWNLPPPPSKMFASGPGAFASQTGLPGNFVGNAHQHQSLMVPHPHHHPPPPLPYFPAFQLHHHPEFQPAMEPSYENPSPSSTFTTEVREDQPKVIVPNIEEELQFLSEGPAVAQEAKTPVPEKKINPTNPASGFMASYMKFLQGERDTSPPPQNRGGRKAAWSRTKVYQPLDVPKTLDNVNGTAVTPEKPAEVADKAKESQPSRTYDPQDDPRYFPLPKPGSKRKRFCDSDNDSSDSDRELMKSKPAEVKQTHTTKTVHPVVKSKVNTSVTKTTDKAKKVRQPKVEKPSAKKKPEQEEVDPLFLPPRRETSRRKAKEKTNIKQFLDRQENEDENEVDEFHDSDSDPAWTPAIKETSDEEGQRRRGQRRLKPLVFRKKPAKAQASSRDADGDSSSDSQDVPLAQVYKKLVVNNQSKSESQVKEGKSKGGKKLLDKSVIQEKAIQDAQEKQQLVEKNVLATERPQGKDSDDGSQDGLDMMPFKSGEFVVMKSDLSIEFPPIWRIDGKTLLQKYEPFDQSGKTLYRNISTYSGWTPQNRHIYQQVPVKFRVQNRLETIVEFLREELNLNDEEIIDKSMKEMSKYQDNFEVYIQTLISQALDSNFLTEIFQEQDDYFLSNVKTVDDLTEERKSRLMTVALWRGPALQRSVGTWPCFNVIADLPTEETRGKVCSACERSPISVRLQMYGQPYNSTTLEGSQPDASVSNLKDFLVCLVCAERVELYNKVAHQKYLMFLECAKRVAEKRCGDPYKDTTIILNELLADEVWLNQLFHSVRATWADIDKLHHQFTRGTTHEVKTS